MKSAIALQLFTAATLAQDQIDFSAAEDKDQLATQALLNRLSQCTNVKI